MSLHALTLEQTHGRLAILDVEGFPIERSWFVVFPRGKQLSVVARTFFDYLRTEGSLLAAGTHADPSRADMSEETPQPPSPRIAHPASAPRG
jgi:hypothetical protein